MAYYVCDVFVACVVLRTPFPSLPLGDFGLRFYHMCVIYVGGRRFLQMQFRCRQGT